METKIKQHVGYTDERKLAALDALDAAHEGCGNGEEIGDTTYVVIGFTTMPEGIAATSVLFTREEINDLFGKSIEEASELMQHISPAAIAGMIAQKEMPAVTSKIAKMADNVCQGAKFHREELRSSGEFAA